MKKILLAGAAIALLGGTASAQMQGGYSGQQNMNQQMRNMDQQNPRMHKKPTTGDQQEQANPSGTRETKETTPQGEERGGSEMRENTQVRSSVRITPTKTIPVTEKTKIRETIIERGGAPRVDRLTFAVRVGAPIPRTIRVVPVPQEIVAIYPEWSGFLYFVSGDEIIVVDPNSFAVVGVLET